MHFSSVHRFYELRITKNWISLETIVNSIIIILDASLPRVVGHEVLFLCFGFAVPNTVVSLLLDDVVRDGENIQSPLSKKNLAGFAFNQEMSTIAIDHSLIPKKKAFWAFFGIVSHNSNNFTLPNSRIHLCSSGSSLEHQNGYRSAPGSEHLSTHHALLASGPRASWAHLRFQQYFVSVHDHGRQRSDRGPQRLSCPHVGLTVHWAVSVRKSTTGQWPNR